MTTKDISGMLETPEFPVEQTALLAYSGNARQRRKAWRKDSRLIIEASCKEQLARIVPALGTDLAAAFYRHQIERTPQAGR